MHLFSGTESLKHRLVVLQQQQLQSNQVIYTRDNTQLFQMSNPLLKIQSAVTNLMKISLH